MSIINEFSIQLYSVKEETAKDFAGVLRKLGKIGYTGVEFAGYGELPAKEMKAILNECNIKSVGSHVSIENLTNNLEKELAYNHEIGTEYIIVPHAKMETVDDVLKTADFLSKTSEKCIKAGFKFGYHNHAHEFIKADNTYLLDLLYKNVDRNNVFLELDLYWASYAGVEPLAYMEKNKDIIKLLHLKQIKDYESKECVDLDEGIIDFKTIITKAKQLGVEHFILEQESFSISPFVSVEKGFKHIMSLS